MKKGIIIGASSGIGWELAIQLAALGYQLGLMARRVDRLEELATQLLGSTLFRVQICVILSSHSKILVR